MPNYLSVQTVFSETSMVVGAERLTCVLMKLWFHIHRESCWFLQLVRFPEVETTTVFLAWQRDLGKRRQGEKRKESGVKRSREERRGEKRKKER